MKMIGIDYGERRVGIAVSDEGGTFAFPHSTLENNGSLFDSVAAIMADKKIEQIIMGDTRSSGGLPNPVTKEMEVFGNALSERTGKPVHFVPELGSTAETARYAPPGKEHDDAAAAAFILQRFLDMRVRE